MGICISCIKQARWKKTKKNLLELQQRNLIKLVRMLEKNMNIKITRIHNASQKQRILLFNRN